jgi:peroxiredoxin
LIEPGSEAPDFELRDHSGARRRLSEFRGRRVLLVFYPGDFSPVCNDQLALYQEVLPQIEAEDVQVLGISVDSWYSHGAFHERLGLGFPLLADFHPKGEVAGRYGAYSEEHGKSGRSLVLIDEEGRVAWVHVPESPGVIPGANLIFDALAAGG